MEFLALLEGCGCFLECATLLGGVVDGLTWFNGRPNRVERKEAKKAGEPRPPLDPWNWAFIILTPFVLLLIVALISRAVAANG